jgi:DNA-binding transcriptional MerR regulator
VNGSEPGLYWQSVTPKVYKAGEVCELVQVQPYVLRSWEKEFPGIGIQKSPESPRLYRQIDLEHVQRIKQLVFVEGLTVSGARRRLEDTAPSAAAIAADAAADVAEVLDALGADARTKLARVRDGLRQIHAMLAGAPGVTYGGGFALSAPPARPARAKLARPAPKAQAAPRKVVAKKLEVVRKKTPAGQRKRARR